MERTAQELAAQYYADRRVIDPARRPELLALLSAFADPNEDPNRSPNFRSPEVDPVPCFLEMLMHSGLQRDPEVVLLLLRCLKILSRKQANRCVVGEMGLRAILVNLSPPLSMRIAAEGANALLNICYEPQNVEDLLGTSGVDLLVDFLGESDVDLQANAAGAIQSICFQPKGRQAVRDQDGIQSLLPLLASSHSRVVARVAGAIHNLSSDAESIRIIRKYCGIPRLVQLLADPAPGVAGAAAGALQNVSRELASRLLIRELDAIPPLAELLSSQDVHAQVCGAGALLNILGPELECGEHGPGATRRALGRLMSLVIATSMIHDAVFEQRPELG